MSIKIGRVYITIRIPHYSNGVHHYNGDMFQYWRDIGLLKQFIF